MLHVDQPKYYEKLNLEINMSWVKIIGKKNFLLVFMWNVCSFSDALEFVFDVFDFDGKLWLDKNYDSTFINMFFFEDNKQLDRQEYNLWTFRTTGEQITDEDWSSIRGKTLMISSKDG